MKEGSARYCEDNPHQQRVRSFIKIVLSKFTFFYYKKNFNEDTSVMMKIEDDSALDKEEEQADAVDLVGEKHVDEKDDSLKDEKKLKLVSPCDDFPPSLQVCTL
jgi:hypothetical protein